MSKEVDAFAARPGYSHGLVRVGVLVTAAGFVLLLFAIGAFVQGLLLGEVSEGQAMAAILGSFGLFFLSTTVGIVGAVVLLVGKHRLWETIEADERARASPAPLSAVMMTIVTVLAIFVPFVGFVLPLIVLYMTQDHLNRMWDAAKA